MRGVNVFGRIYVIGLYGSPRANTDVFFFRKLRIYLALTSFEQGEVFYRWKR